MVTVICIQETGKPNRSLINSLYHCIILPSVPTMWITVCVTNNIARVYYIQQVQIYLNMPLPHSSEPADEKDVLGWWREHSPALPNLAKLSRQVFSIPASSSASERNFSAAGRTLSEQRSRLNPESVDAILFLHSVL